MILEIKLAQDSFAASFGHKNRLDFARKNFHTGFTIARKNFHTGFTIAAFNFKFPVSQ